MVVDETCCRFRARSRQGVKARAYEWWGAIHFALIPYDQYKGYDMQEWHAMVDGVASVLRTSPHLSVSIEKLYDRVCYVLTVGSKRKIRAIRRGDRQGAPSPPFCT